VEDVEHVEDVEPVEHEEHVEPVEDGKQTEVQSIEHKMPPQLSEALGP